MEFEIQRNDIARMQVDAVVLPANWRLIMGTGASLALYEAAGREELEAECAIKREEAKRRSIRLEPGVTIPTRAYALPAKIILHTIVPKWNAKKAQACYEELCKSYASALIVADESGCESVAFPLLASGNNRFDPDLAIDIAIESLERFEPRNRLKTAYLVTFGGDMTQKMRDRGYEVEEIIDQVHVLDQDMHQAHFVKNDEGWEDRWKKDKAPLQAMVDDGVKWIGDPENQKQVLRLAMEIAVAVLPEEDSGGVARNVISVLMPFLGGDRGR